MNSGSPALLHIHPGDCSADSLRASGINGKVIVWCDVLMDGPLRLEDSEASRSERAAVLSATTGNAKSVEQCGRRLHSQDEALLAYRDFRETVLWFDACLYDQTILVRLLDWFSRQELADGQLSLLCVGEYPGFEKFLGLGELTPAQLAGLLPQRMPVTHSMLDLARRAWRAFCAGSPAAVAGLADEDCSALPYLGAALIRFLEQLPGTANGLSRLEQECLEALSAGPVGPAELFKSASAAEANPFFGDTMVWGCLNALAAAKHPLVVISGPEPRLPQWEPREINRWQLALTPVGEQVLAGQVDAVGLNGIDRWLGGTHLRPGNVWRWDGCGRVLVPPS